MVQCFLVESNSLLLKNGSFFLSFVLSFCKSDEPLLIEIDLMTYEIEFDFFIVLDIEVYEDYLAVYRTLTS